MILKAFLKRNLRPQIITRPDYETGAKARPFTPKGRRYPIFYLHIPKTSGSSVNAFFERIYGTRNMKDHVEYALPQLMAAPETTMVADCVTGHVPLSRWRLYEGSEKYNVATILRDPWPRLVSHINWVGRIDTANATHSGQSRSQLFQASDLTKQVDFTNRQSMADYFQAIEKLEKFTPFANYQTRMLMSNSYHAMHKELVAADIDNAYLRLSELAIFGFADDQRGFQADVLAHMKSWSRPREEVKNQGQSRVLTADNELAREVFAPWFAADETLFARARALAAERAKS